MIRTGKQAEGIEIVGQSLAKEMYELPVVFLDTNIWRGVVKSQDGSLNPFHKVCGDLVQDFEGKVNFTFAQSTLEELKRLDKKSLTKTLRVMGEFGAIGSLDDIGNLVANEATHLLKQLHFVKESPPPHLLAWVPNPTSAKDPCVVLDGCNVTPETIKALMAFPSARKEMKKAIKPDKMGRKQGNSMQEELNTVLKGATEPECFSFLSRGMLRQGLNKSYRTCQIYWEQSVAFPEKQIKEILNNTRGIPVAENLECLFAALESYPHITKVNSKRNHTWLADIITLASALPYVDAILTERQFGHILEETGLAEKYHVRVGKGAKWLRSEIIGAAESPRKDLRDRRIMVRSPATYKEELRRATIGTLIEKKDTNP